MKKRSLSCLLALSLLLTTITVALAYADTKSTQFLGNSGVWYYGTNKLGPATISGDRWKIPFYGDTSNGVSNQVSVTGAMYLWNGSSSHFVSTSPSSHTAIGTAVISGTAYHSTGNYSTVTYDCYHQGFEDPLGNENWLEDGANNTSTSCSLPTAKSSALIEDTLNCKEEIYNQIKINYNEKIVNLKLASKISEYYYCHMLDWSNFNNIILPLKDKPEAIDAFSQLVMQDIHNEYIKDGDSAPAFWFSQDGKKAYIGITKENGSFIFLTTSLNEKFLDGKLIYNWTKPVK